MTASQRYLVIALVVALVAGFVTFAVSGGEGGELAAADTTTPTEPAVAEDDIIPRGGGDDIISGGDGDDTILGAGGDDAPLGDLADDTLDDGASDDVLLGGGQDDVLRGEAGDDTLLGNPESDDVLVGGDDPAPTAAPGLAYFCPGVVHTSPPGNPIYPSDIVVVVGTNGSPGQLELLIPPAFGAEPVLQDLDLSGQTTIHVPIDSFNTYRVERVTYYGPDGMPVDVTQQAIDSIGSAEFTVDAAEGPVWATPTCDPFVDVEAFTVVP